MMEAFLMPVMAIRPNGLRDGPLQEHSPMMPGCKGPAEWSLWLDFIYGGAMGSLVKEAPWSGCSMGRWQGNCSSDG